VKRLTVFCILASAATWGAEGPRNPFWPQDYEGIRHPITTEARVKPKPKQTATAKAAAKAKARAAAQQKADQARKAPPDADAAAEAAAKAREAARRAEEDRRWQAARHTLRFGGTMGFNGARSAITINDRIYSPGDYISCNHGDLRFTWKIEALSNDGKITLRRIKYGTIKTEPRQ